MKNKELVTELAARMGWTAQEVAETLSVLSSVVSSRLVDNDTIYLQGFMLQTPMPNHPIIHLK